eukprot:6488871-Amphidinium_carterae.5
MEESVSVSNEDSAGKARRKGAGGMWRAWIRYHSYGCKGKPSLKVLARTYRMARASADPILLHIRHLGAAATLAARVKKRCKSSFGLTTEHCKRVKGKIARRSLWMYCKGKSKVKQASFLAASSSWHGALPDAVSAAKTVKHLDGVERKLKEAALVNTLKEFAQGSGLEPAKRLKEAIPSLPFEATDLIPVPCSSASAFYLPFKGSENATRAAGFAHQNRTSNLSGYLEAEWLAAHEPIAGQSERWKSGKGLASKCCATGFCVCTGEGKKLWQLRGRILDNMKKQFRGRDKRSLLTSGRVVAFFNRVTACTCHADASGEIFMHLGHMSLSPYRPTVQILQRVNNHPLACTVVENQVVLEAQPKGANKDKPFWLK